MCKNTMTKLSASDLAPPVSPPGKAGQAINNFLQHYVVETVFHGFLWTFILLVVSPFLGCITFMKTILFALLQPYYFFKNGGDGRARLKLGKNSSFEMAVCITGADTGFGKELALELSSKGFIVFTGCLTTDGMESYKKYGSSIIPLKMDVTKDEDVQQAVCSINSWLKSDDASPERPRVLHALVNNAGVTRGGLIDWLSIDDYKFQMDVSFFGMLRVSKAFYPIFKDQCGSGKYSDTRVVNLSSIAGLLSGVEGMSGYNASKFAAEAFSTTLRAELKRFNVKVCTVNPAIHRTPMAAAASGNRLDLWNRLDPKLQKEYGEEFFIEFDRIKGTQNKKTWDPDMVITKLTSCVELCDPPVQVLIGSDAILALLFSRLPAQTQADYIGNKVEVKPAIMSGKE